MRQVARFTLIVSLGTKIRINKCHHLAYLAYSFTVTKSVGSLIYLLLNTFCQKNLLLITCSCNLLHSFDKFVIKEELGTLFRM